MKISTQVAEDPNSTAVVKQRWVKVRLLLTDAATSSEELTLRTS